MQQAAIPAVTLESLSGDASALITSFTHDVKSTLNSLIAVEDLVTGNFRNKDIPRLAPITLGTSA